MTGCIRVGAASRVGGGSGGGRKVLPAPIGPLGISATDWQGVEE